MNIPSVHVTDVSIAGVDDGMSQLPVALGRLAGTPTSTHPRNAPSTDGGGCRLSLEFLNRH